MTPTVARPDPRRAHRLLCVVAGGLALLGGTLAAAVDPWFAALAAVGGAWLMLAPDTSSATPVTQSPTGGQPCSI